MKWLCLADGDLALVSNTPCARARVRIEIRPFWGQGAAAADEVDPDGGG